MKNKKRNKLASTRTLVLFLVAAPLIGYTAYYGYRKSTESEERAYRCQQECSAQGYPGHEFRWDVFSGPQCSCITGAPQS